MRRKTAPADRAAGSLEPARENSFARAKKASAKKSIRLAPG
jgi:hypothetical protein